MNTYTFHLRVVLGMDGSDKPIYGRITSRSWDTKHEATRFAIKYLSDYDVRLVTVTQEGE